MKNLRNIRIDHGWSLTYVGKRLGVTRQTVHNWEKGRNYPTTAKAIQLADLYGVSVAEILGMEE